MSNTWRKALQLETPLQIIGVMNAYIALMAEQAGYKAIYLSGAGISNFSYGIPDLGMTSMDNVLDEVRKIRSVSSLPLLVDIDTGWGNGIHISRTIRFMEKSGASAVHIEDQAFPKKCGHLTGKNLVSKEEMTDRIKAAVDGRENQEFIIIARTDAHEVEGLDSAIDRAKAYVEAGADMIFPEALTSLKEFSAFRREIQAPLLANLTEFGKTPLLTLDELRKAKIEMALYPLSCARAMNFAAWELLQTLRKAGTQKQSLHKMQTREELYKIIKYDPYEEKR